MHPVDTGSTLKIHFDHKTFIGQLSQGARLIADNTQADIEARILDAACRLLLHYGYDKTTQADIASEAGIAKSTLYRRWKKKDDVMMALLWRESRQYTEDWLSRIEDDPHSGSMSSLFKHALLALYGNAFMHALLTRERHLVGRMVHIANVNGIYQQRAQLISGLIRRMQEVGAIRQDISAETMAFVMNGMQYGILSLAEMTDDAQTPDMQSVLHIMSGMIDRYLSPPDDKVDSEAAKAIIREYAQQVRDLLDKLAQA